MNTVSEDLSISMYWNLNFKFLMAVKQYWVTIGVIIVIYIYVNIKKKQYNFLPITKYPVTVDTRFSISMKPNEKQFG